MADHASIFPMLVTAHQVRTGLAISAAGATIVAALLLVPPSHGGSDCTRTSAAIGCPPTRSDILSANLVSSEIVASEQDIAVTITMLGARASGRPPLSLAIVIDRS